jgi:hypothetical protein
MNKAFKKPNPLFCRGRRLKSNFLSAFSLIEVSVVILIIGIFIAAIMTSNNLISKFRLRTAQSMTVSSPINGISDNALWLESSLSELSLGENLNNGDPVGSWLDNSHNIHKTTISAVLNGPTYANTINYIPAVKFDNTSNINHLQIDDASFLNGNDYTIFILEKRMSANSGVDNYLLGQDGSFALGYESDASIIQSHGEGSSSTNQASIESLSSYSNKPRMITFTHSSVDGNKIYINATLANEDNSNEAKAHLSGITFLAIGKGYNGEIGEIAIFNRKLTTSERQEVENYLSKKWRAPNNRDSFPICTSGTITSSGCDASCPAPTISGITSSASIANGSSNSYSCNASGYTGSTPTYSCVNGSLSPTPTTTDCSNNGCSSGYSLISGECVRRCSVSVNGSNITDIDLGITQVSCSSSGNYSGTPFTFSACDGNPITGSCACATGYSGANCDSCDAVNGYVDSGGSCVLATCDVDATLGVVESGTVDFGSGSFNCDTTKNFASGTFDYQCGVDGNITTTSSLPNNRCGCNVTTMLSAFNSTTNVCDQLLPMAWLDASDTSTINASSNLVNSWNDKAGTNHATQSDSARKPSSGTRTIKGMNVIDFDGSRAFLLPSITFYGKTFFIVAGLDSTADHPQLIANANGTGSLNNQIKVVSGTLEIVAGNNPWMAGTAASLGSFTSNPSIAMMQGSAKINFRVNSSAISQIGDNNYDGANAFPISMLGCRRSDYVNCMDGYIAELIIFNSILSDSQANAVYDYLSDKWQ